MRVVIAGGGYGGVALARRLGDRAEVTLISRENFLTFTPMLAEVASGDIEPRHITAPLRQLCPRATVVVGEIDAVDLEALSTTVRMGETRLDIGGDVLVLAAGSVPADFGVPGVARHAVQFKTIADGLLIRRRLLLLLESAAHSHDPAEASAIVVGAGYSGTELASALADFLGEAIPRYYPSAPPGRVALIDAVDRPVPNLPARLSRSARRALERRGVGLLLGSRVREVTSRGVVLEDGSTVEAATTVWAAGVRPAPLVGDLGDGTRITTNDRMAIGDGVYAIGDAAAVPDGRGGICPPTAQAAIAQGKWLGKHLVHAGKRPRRFRYRTKGELVSLGHRNAVGRVLGIPVSGWLAWFLWRSYYLGRMPTLLRKLRVALDWTLDIFFPPDVSAIPSGDLGPDL
jgi:NADH dehydrogenase